MRYCYQYKDGSQAPTLRLHPGDWLVLRLSNDLKPPAGSAAHDHSAMSMPTAANRCGDGTMGPWATNLHFHGLTLPPVCHAGRRARTRTLRRWEADSNIAFKFPPTSLPGCIGITPTFTDTRTRKCKEELPGLSIVEGIERADLQLGGMPERVFVVRDQELLHPDAQPRRRRRCRRLPLFSTPRAMS